MPQASILLKGLITLFLFCLGFSSTIIPSLAISPSSFGAVPAANLSTTNVIQQKGNRPVPSPLISSEDLSQSLGTSGSGPKVGGTPLTSATSPGLNAWT